MKSLINVAIFLAFTAYAKKLIDDASVDFVEKMYKEIDEEMKMEDLRRMRETRKGAEG